MLTVKTYLAPSPVHGIGLYAAEAIPAESIVWQYNAHIDVIYPEDTFLSICLNIHPNTLQHFLNCSYKRSGRYFYLTDNARFINHSDKANIAFVDDYTEIALQEIKPEEEILENYLFSYDDSDFFFQESVNPDPLFYISTILHRGKAHARRQNLP